MAERPTTDQLKQLVIDYSAGCGLDPNIALIQVARESANFRPDVVYGSFVGGAGEKGMTQFTPGTWARFGSGPQDNAYDPNYAMGAYCGYMKYLLGLFGDYERALQGYNGGEGNVQRGTVSAAARRYASEVIAQAQKGEITSSGSDQGDHDTGSSLLTWLAIGGAIAVVWVLVDD